VSRLAPVAVAVGLLALGPGAAGAAAQYPATASFSASDSPDLWTAAGGGGGGSSVAIALGGTVTFDVATSEPHDASFPAAMGVACTAGGSPAATRIPSTPSASWSGSCTFSQAGYIPFVCTVHSTMKGEVAVAGADGALPWRNPVVSGGNPVGGWAPAAPGQVGGPPNPAAVQAALRPIFMFVRRQDGSTLRGRIANAKGATATVDISARRRDLSIARRKPTGTTRLRRLVRAANAAGDVTVAVRLPVLARRALRRRGRLVLTLRATARGGSIPTGSETWTREITLRTPTAAP
jgi:hypothetical protein